MQIVNSDAFYREIGSRIRNARVLSDISQEVLATQLDLTRASIINIEKGRHKPSLLLLIEIAGILMVHYSSLIPEAHPSSKSSLKSATIDLTNAVTDQEKFDKSTKKSLAKFLQSIPKY